MAETFKRCKTPFGFDVNGMTRVIPGGAVVASSDEAYKKFKEHFEDIEVHVAGNQARQSRAEGGAAARAAAEEAAAEEARVASAAAEEAAAAEASVEAATAAPGQKRNVVRIQPKQ